VRPGEFRARAGLAVACLVTLVCLWASARVGGEAGAAGGAGAAAEVRR
jgi:hypothetical protein